MYFKFKRFFYPRRFFFLCFCYFFTPCFTQAPALSASSPAATFDANTYTYFEIYPANVTVKKIKQLFFSLMNKEKAETEWKSLEDYFLEEIGINVLSTEYLAAAGFQLNEPIGIGMNYSVERITSPAKNVNLKYHTTLTAILPAAHPVKAYEFFKLVFKQRDNRQKRQYPADPPARDQSSRLTVTEIEKDLFLKITDPGKNNDALYIFRANHAIILSGNPELARKYAAPSANSLEKTTGFQEARKFLENGKSGSDITGFFYINQKISAEETRINPRLLFDNIVMDNTYIKELSANAEYISGAISIREQELKVAMNYAFQKDFFKNNRSFLADSFNFKNQNFFPDNLAAPPMLFFKWQTNFSGDKKNLNQKNIINDQNIGAFISRLSGGLVAVIPENIKSLFKENISLYVQDIPSLRDINNYYLWKGYLSMNYNPANFDKFKLLMNNLVSASAKSKNVKIVFSNINNKLQWEFQITRYVKRYDKTSEQVVYDENIIKMYVLADSKQIVITHDPALAKKMPPSSSSPLSKKLYPENNASKQMIFTYVDAKKFLTYLSKSSPALRETYLSYFENVKSLFLLVNQENNLIREELVIRVEK